MHKNKAKVRKFPWKRILGTTVMLTIFSNIQLIKKRFGSNYDRHMKEQFWNYEACRFIIFKVIIRNPTWKNIKYHILARKGSITYKNFEVFVRNLTQSFNLACWYEVGIEFLPKQWPPGKHSFARSRRRLIHDFTVSNAHVPKSMVGKLQHSISTWCENQAFFNYFHPKVFFHTLVNVCFTFQKYVTKIECLCK